MYIHVHVCIHVHVGCSGLTNVPSKFVVDIYCMRTYVLAVGNPTIHVLIATCVSHTER